VQPAAGVEEDELLRLAASLERGSEHPLADAILRRGEGAASPFAEATDFDSPPARA
jgi:Cu+-exporting ATPase